MLNKVSGVLASILVIGAACFGQGSFQALTPGQSTRGDVTRVLGQPARALSATLFEYTPPAGIAKVEVAYSAESNLVGRIEVYFLKPISRPALIQKFNLSQRADESRTNAEGKLVEYFADSSLLAL